MIWPRRRIRIETGKELTEEELDTALAVDQSDPLWRALHQLIDVAMENAQENANANMDPATVMAGYVGGGAHLKMLRDELISRREAGIKMIGGARPSARDGAI